MGYFAINFVILSDQQRCCFFPQPHTTSTLQSSIVFADSIVVQLLHCLLRENYVQEKQKIYISKDVTIGG